MDAAIVTWQNERTRGKTPLNMRWITFDCFGTLVDWRNGFRTILSAAEIERSAELEEAYHRHEAAVQSEKYRRYRDVTRISLERAAAEIGVALSPWQRTAIADNWARLPVFDDTVPALVQLKNDGWKLAVLTNCDDDLFAKTEHAIKVPFDAVITAERVGAYKPALGHFEYFRDNILDDGDEWNHTACSWIHDIAPARALNVPRIWIDRETSGHDPLAATAVLTNLRDLPRVVSGLSR